MSEQNPFEHAHKLTSANIGVEEVTHVPTIPEFEVDPMEQVMAEAHIGIVDAAHAQAAWQDAVFKAAHLSKQYLRAMRLKKTTRKTLTDANRTMKEAKNKLSETLLEDNRQAEVLRQRNRNNY